MTLCFGTRLSKSMQWQHLKELFLTFNWWGMMLVKLQVWKYWNSEKIQGRLFSLDALIFAFVVSKLCSTVSSALALLSHGPSLPMQPRGPIRAEPDVPQPSCSITSFPDVSVLVEQKAGDHYLEENNWYSADWHCLRSALLLFWPLFCIAVVGVREGWTCIHTWVIFGPTWV